MSNRVTVQEQIERGILQPSNSSSKYVPAKVETQAITHRPAVEVMPPQHNFDMAVTPTGTTHVEMKTSAQDRAWGFLIASTPRTFVFSLAIVLISMLATDIGVIAGIVMLVSIFSVVELASYIYTLTISAEGTAHMEAKRKWDVIEREQRKRWKHYERINRGDNNG